ncbi:hypothetical protein D9615_007441 [Tricholomella constricta]|uniref:Uncharacterized protein n=1 Tax=Tricholomella constricta TaxID=117010 RepID=A0A8H5LXP0_9AGAR|nr:hypothetical protein D9615_007441 [Tricholomella constricta]
MSANDFYGGKPQDQNYGAPQGQYYPPQGATESRYPHGQADMTFEHYNAQFSPAMPAGNSPRPPQGQGGYYPQQPQQAYQQQGYPQYGPPQGGYPQQGYQPNPAPQTVYVLINKRLKREEVPPQDAWPVWPVYVFAVAPKKYAIACSKHI